MVNLEFSEYHFFDDVLSDMKLTPADIEIPVPRYFTQENEKDIKDRMKLMAETLAKYRLDETSDKKEEIKMSLEEAIKIIQVGYCSRQSVLPHLIEFSHLSFCLSFAIATFLLFYILTGSPFLSTSTLKVKTIWTSFTN